jgi:Icc-related predicted phosphoesterase
MPTEYHADVALYLVSDLHGAPDTLGRAVPDGATLVLLGDLINFIDYISMTGILTEVFPREAVEKVVTLRTAGRIEEARAVMRARAEGREHEVRTAIESRVVEQYEKVFTALPDPTYLILGNVDNPAIVDRLARRTPAVRCVDGSTVVLEEERFGFVGGALPSPLGVAGEITPEEMRRKIEAIGAVDVVCSHIPPAVPELCYDTRAGRPERGSDDLLEYLRDVQPRRAYFGHVHQPLVSAMHIGRTLCINVGYFRATGRAFPHSPADRVRVAPARRPMSLSFRDD